MECNWIRTWKKRGAKNDGDPVPGSAPVSKQYTIRLAYDGVDILPARELTVDRRISRGFDKSASRGRCRPLLRNIAGGAPGPTINVPKYGGCEFARIDARETDARVHTADCGLLRP